MPFTSNIWNLQNIITEFRGITGRPDIGMMTDQAAVNYINYYYQFVLPKELKIFWGYTYHSFYTMPHVDQYLAPTTFQTFNPGVYCDGFPMEWYLDPDNFFSDYPQQTNKTVVAQGTGSLNLFTFQIPAFPVLARSVYVTDGIQIAQDNGAGGFVNPLNSYAPLTGSINYASGVVSGLIFPVPPALNANIVQTSQTYVPARPRGILFFPTHLLPNADGPNPVFPPPPITAL